MLLTRYGKANYDVMEKDKVYILENGDSFTLSGDLHSFQVSIKPTEKKISSLKQAATANLDDLEKQANESSKNSKSSLAALKSQATGNLDEITPPKETPVSGMEVLKKLETAKLDVTMLFYAIYNLGS